MQAKFVRICVMGISIMTSSLGMAAARADFALEEDFSGTNIWDSPVPTLVRGTADGNSQISSETIGTAGRLSQELENAYISRDDYLGDQRLDRAVEEAKDFLNDLNREQAEKLRSAGRSRIW